jgi:copper(I)-binding protein
MRHLPSRRLQTDGPAARPLPGIVLLFGIVAGVLTAGIVAQAAERGLTVGNAWMRSVVPSRPAAGYFTLSNETGQAHVLVGATSPACGMLMLHQSIHQNGEDRMTMVKSISVPAHGTVKFAPGGYHLMCTSPSKDVAPGHSIPVTLRFADGSVLKATFPVRGAMGK